MKLDDMTEWERAVISYAAAVLATVAEAGPFGAPEGTLYAGLMAHGASWAQWECVRELLTRQGLVRSRHHQMSATELGRRVVTGNA